MNRLLFYLICLTCLISQTVFAQENIQFSNQIRPILADHCYACHGPDAATREGGLRLDDKASAFKPADSGAIPIVPGDPAASEIIKRIHASDEDELMPPPAAKKPLSTQQIQLLERWIAAGAPWEEHWAFKPAQRPDLPTPQKVDWVKNPIDHFVLQRLEEQGLTPSPEASKTTLIRRVYLDLIGLPPTANQVDAFINDEDPLAYEKLVNQLLASPSYGEHMATFWLDAARFADTNGYQNDFRRSMWLWRDWVIKAFNHNLPYNEFTIQQLAGDMLPNATIEQQIASGFNRNHRSNTEGGSINEEWLVENVVDRVETTATVFLGLTMGCARCHDHKYDPISQREFYQFFSYFYNVDEQGVYTERRGNAGPTVAVPTPELQTRVAETREKLQLAKRDLEAKQQALQQSQENWSSQLLASARMKTDWPAQVFCFPVEANGVENEPPIPWDRWKSNTFGKSAEITSTADGFANLGTAFNFDAAQEFTLSAWVRPTQFGAIISRMDESNDYRGFDVLIMPNGRINVHLIHQWPKNATKVTTKIPIQKNQWTHVVVTNRAPGRAKDIQVYLNGHSVACSIDSDSLTGSTLTDHPTWLGFRAKTNRFAGLIGPVKVWDTTFSPEWVQQLFQKALADRIDLEDLAESYRQEIQQLYFYSQTLDELNQVKALEQETKRLQREFPTTMVMKERTQPRQAYVLDRGQYDRPDKTQPVTAGLPALFKSNRQPRNRLELARWLVDGENPLTARVAVNHWWSRYFGIGLLETPENFGVQSPVPSHPLLLDWLATELVRTEWDVKDMQRLIVTSATYRQSSMATPEAFSEDPQNRNLARGPRFRLPAESIRDNALFISGLLTQRVGGPSIKPYQPAGLWAELAGGAGEPPYQQAKNDDLYRRSLYIYRKRTVPHPTMTTFDGGGRDVCAVSRDRTNTPLQALALMNDATYVEAARALATEVVKAAADHDERLKIAFRRATCRWPLSSELAVLESAYRKYQQHFAESPHSAEAILQIGQWHANSNISNVDLAAYSMVCSLILNLDEVITKE